MMISRRRHFRAICNAAFFHDAIIERRFYAADYAAGYYAIFLSPLLRYTLDFRFDAIDSRFFIIISTPMAAAAEIFRRCFAFSIIDYFRHISPSSFSRRRFQPPASRFHAAIYILFHAVTLPPLIFDDAFFSLMLHYCFREDISRFADTPLPRQRPRR